MAKVTAAQVKELREKTGVGMMDAKKALVAVDGDMDKAIDFLREKGMAKAAKKSDRVAAEGLADVEVVGNTAAVVEINAETDFVAQNQQFKDLVKRAMHVAAINPKYVNRDQVPASEVEHEKAVLTEEAKNEGKPENIIEKMVAGRLNKFFAEVALDDQAFVKDPDLTVAKFMASKDGKVKAFVRYEVGEGIEKKADNFVEEVMSQVK